MVLHGWNVRLNATKQVASLLPWSYFMNLTSSLFPWEWKPRASSWWVGSHLQPQICHSPFWRTSCLFGVILQALNMTTTGFQFYRQFASEDFHGLSLGMHRGEIIRNLCQAAVKVALSPDLPLWLSFLQCERGPRDLSGFHTIIEMVQIWLWASQCAVQTELAIYCTHMTFALVITHFLCAFEMYFCCWHTLNSKNTYINKWCCHSGPLLWYNYRNTPYSVKNGI